jgi:hypothetical protein
LNSYHKMIFLQFFMQNSLNKLGNKTVGNPRVKPMTIPNTREVIAFLVDFCWRFTQGTNFYSISLVLFLICFNTPTKCIYKFSNSCGQYLRSYRIFSSILLDFWSRYEFLLNFFSSFFDLFCYTYRMYLQILEQLWSILVKLSHF